VQRDAELDRPAGVRVFGATADEAAVVAGKHRDVGTEPLGHGASRAGGDRVSGLLADAEHDPGAGRTDGLEVVLVPRHRDGPLGEQHVVAVAVVLGGHPEHRRVGGRLGEVGVGELARPHRQRDELGHAGAEAAVLVGLPDTAEGAVGLLGVVRERPGRGRFVGDEGGDVAGVQRDPRQPGNGTAARAEHVDATLPEVGGERVQVGRLVLRGLVVATVAAHRAATQAARVVGDDGAVRELSGQIGEAVGLHRLADHEQQGPSVGGRDGSVHVVHEVDVGQVQGLGGGRGHRGLLGRGHAHATDGRPRLRHRPARRVIGQTIDRSRPSQ
jgi:hypothetical protein